MKITRSEYEMAMSGKKINAVKMFRERANLGLADAKHYLDIAMARKEFVEDWVANAPKFEEWFREQKASSKHL